jgi:hypothetical protein
MIGGETPLGSLDTDNWMMDGETAMGSSDRPAHKETMDGETVLRS